MEGEKEEESASNEDSDEEGSERTNTTSFGESEKNDESSGAQVFEKNEGEKDEDMDLTNEM